MTSRSAHHLAPQIFCADTTIYITKCPFKTTHIQVAAYSVLCSAFFFINNIACRVFAIMIYADYHMVVPWFTYQTFRLFFPVTSNAANDVCDIDIYVKMRLLVLVFGQGSESLETIQSVLTISLPNPERGAGPPRQSLLRPYGLFCQHRPSLDSSLN